MNLYEAQEFFGNMFPGKNVTFEFDNNCIRQIEIVHTFGIPNHTGHCEFQKVKVTVDGDSSYVSIAPHRACITFKEIKSMVNNYNDIWISDDLLKERDSQELANETGLSLQNILDKKSVLINVSEKK